MINVYINYPNAHMTIHRESDCNSIRMNEKEGQRIVQIHRKNLSKVIKRFRKQEYKFAAHKEKNDLWMQIDFENYEFELAVAKYLFSILQTFYKPFRDVVPKEHDCLSENNY